MLSISAKNRDYTMVFHVETPVATRLVIDYHIDQRRGTKHLLALHDGYHRVTPYAIISRGASSPLPCSSRIVFKGLLC